MSQKAQPTRLFTLIGSCHPSTPHASAMLRSIVCSSARAHSLPALLIPEDYRARAVALHARELIL